MKNIFAKSLAVGLATFGIANFANAAPEKNFYENLPRTVITTDGEVDDMNSIIRALLYSNEMDIAGIVITSSTYHYAGDAEKNIPAFRWTGTDWIYKFLDDYEKVHKNLIKHDKNYRSADYFRNLTHIGNISNVGEMEKITDGSEFLKKLFLDDDKRTLYVQTWGGTNTTARALKSIEEEYKNTPQWQEIRKKLQDKLFLYIILDQDDSYNNYIAKNWSNLTVVNDRCDFWHFAYAWKFHEDEVNTTLKADWNKENLLNKGALMSNYALMDDGRWIEGELPEEQRGQGYIEKHTEYQKFDFISEGDSPSFLYLANNGLRSYENPSYGGWGGRFGKFEGNRAINDALDYNPVTKKFDSVYSLSRWFNDMQNDFAARADWCVADDFSKANHAPKIEKGKENISAKAGQKITLTAKATDPDGDKLSYYWWRYFEADTYQDDKREKPAIQKNTLGDSDFLISMSRELLPDEKLYTIMLEGETTPKVSFTVPADAKVGDTIHIILEVQDDGAHNLKAYKRFIVTVK